MNVTSLLRVCKKNMTYVLSMVEKWDDNVLLNQHILNNTECAWLFWMINSSTINQANEIHNIEWGCESE